jgi:hypothetical protein
MVGIRSPDGLVVGSCTSHPGVLGSIPKREEPGKTGRHPVLKYRVPHGFHSPRSLVCGGQISPHKPRLVVSHSTCPPLSSSPHAHSFVLGTAVINNNKRSDDWMDPYKAAHANGAPQSLAPAPLHLDHRLLVSDGGKPARTLAPTKLNA